MEDKPRHERILERMGDLVKKGVSKFSINGEGGVTAQGGSGKFLLSSSPTTTGRSTVIDPQYSSYIPPLRRIGDTFQIIIGTVNSVVPQLDTDDGYISIYGDGTPGSVPTIPSANAEVWAKCTVTPTNIFEGDPGPPASYDIGNMRVDFVEIVTTNYGVNTTETLAIIDTSTGAVTAGEYYYWICSILDGVVVETPVLPVRLFLPQGYGSAANYGGLTVGLFGVGIGNPDPNVTYI